MKIRKIKTVALIMAAVMLFFAGFTALSGCSNNETVYKSATVMTASGDARVHRGDGSLPAYKGLSLRHGDSLHTDADSFVTVTLDGDKYALIEPESSVSFSLYENENENVVLITLVYGSVYIEADTPAPEGGRFGIAIAPLGSRGTNVLDAYVLGGEAAYRVETTASKPASTVVQAIAGTVTLSLPTTGQDALPISAGGECRLERDTNGVIKLPVALGATDPYSLPDQYIALGADGVFDSVGNIIQRPLSSDVSLKEITIKKADGTVVPLIPEFDNNVAGYVAETDSVATLTVTANHRKTRTEIQCHTAASVKTDGNTAKVIFSEKEKFHAVSILVIAEDGTEIRFSVNIVPAENE